MASLDLIIVYQVKDKEHDRNNKSSWQNNLQIEEILHFKTSGNILLYIPLFQEQQNLVYTY